MSLKCSVHPAAVLARGSAAICCALTGRAAWLTGFVTALKEPTALETLTTTGLSELRGNASAAWVLSGSVRVGRGATCTPISAPAWSDAHRLVAWPH